MKRTRCGIAVFDRRDRHVHATHRPERQRVGGDAHARTHVGLKRREPSEKGTLGQPGLGSAALLKRAP